MKRPTRTTCRTYRWGLLSSVFFLCLFLGGVGWGKGSETAPVKATTFSTEQGKETEYKLVVSVRNSLDALPLGNPFAPSQLVGTNGAEVANPVKKSAAIEQSQARTVSNAERMIAPEKQQIEAQVMQYQIIGVIRGDRPLVLVEYGGETAVYGVGEGPKGHQIISITDHEVYGEGGLYYRY